MCSVTDFTLTDFTLIAERVWTAVAEPETVTVGVVAGDEGCVVIDTGSSPAQGHQIRLAAEEISGVPVVGAVVTHHHYDHLFGLAAFDDVPTYGHENIAGLVANGEACPDNVMAQLGVARHELMAPNRPFAIATAFNLGQRYVEIMATGPGHSPTDAVIMVPDAGVIFVGDLIEESADPSFGPDSDPQRWATALDAIIPALPAHPIVVPGHGEVVDAAFVRQQRNDIEMAFAQLDYSYPQGLNVETALTRGVWPFSAETMTGLAPMVFQRLRDAGRVVESRTLPLLNADKSWRS